MKITIKHDGEKHSYESESEDGLNATCLVNVLFNLCCSQGWDRDSIAGAMRDKADEFFEEETSG